MNILANVSFVLAIISALFSVLDNSNEFRYAKITIITLMTGLVLLAVTFLLFSLTLLFYSTWPPRSFFID